MCDKSHRHLEKRKRKKNIKKVPERNKKNQEQATF